jgi:hypothetical protein
MEAGYSNYGAALAGYIVARVARVPYEDYVERNILVPLNMERSTIQQRVPPELAPDVARGYVAEDGRFREEPLATYQGVPAGTICATAPDVARFMVAHVQDGRFGERRILEHATARQMHQTLFRPDQRLNGLAYGFLEMDRNGVRIIGHIGSATPVHYSLLALLPDRGIGLFVAYNADTARPLTVGNQTLAAFMDRFSPSPATPSILPPTGFADRAEQFAGEYQRNNFGGSYTTVEKLGRLLNAPTNRRVSNPRDGTLEVDSRLWGNTRFVEIAPDLFRQLDDEERLLFRRDQQGRVQRAMFDGEPEYTYERLRLPETVAFNQLLLTACVVLFGSTLVAAAMGQVLGRRRPANVPSGGLAGAARWVAGMGAAVNLLFLGGLLLALGDPALAMGDYARLRMLLTLPLVATILTGGTLVGAVLAWPRRFWSLPARLHYTAVALAMIGFTWFVATWNLLGFHL